MSLSCAVQLCKRQVDFSDTPGKGHSVEMGHISALYYADSYLTGGHIGVVNTGEEQN